MKRRRSYRRSYGYGKALRTMRKQIDDLHSELRMQKIMRDLRLKLRPKEDNVSLRRPGKDIFRKRRLF
jgi:hypothetical protein